MNLTESWAKINAYRRFIGKFFVQKINVLLVLVKKVRLKTTCTGYEIVFLLTDYKLRTHEESANDFFLKYEACK